MRPQLLQLQNFLSFADATVDLSGLRGLVLLSGEHRGSSAAADSNGAGKSALIDGLCWALYGKMARPKHRAEDVVRRTVGADTMVRLVFEDALGRSIEVRRYRKHSTFKDALYLEVEGADVRGSSMAETQKRIDTVVGLDHDTFIGSVLYTQHPLRGRFAELGDEQKKELLDAILGAEILGRARDLVKKDLRSKETALERARARAQSLREQVAWLERQRDEHVARAARWEEDRSARRAALEGAVTILEERICVHRDREPVSPEPGTACEESLRAVIRTLEEAERQSRERDAVLERRLSAARSREAAATALLRKLQAELAGLDGLRGACPVCSQPITPEVRHAHGELLRDQMAEKAAALLDARGEAASLAVEREQGRRTWDSARAEREREIAELRTRAEQSRAARAEHMIWQRELEGLEAQLARGNKDLTEVDHEGCPFAPAILDEDAELGRRSTELSSLEADLRILESERDRLVFWERGFGPRGLKSYLLDGVLPLLNERARCYAELLTAGTLSVQFSTTLEKDDTLEDRFTVQIRHRSGVDSYALLSGGERQRVNLIINLALQDLVGSRASRPLPIAIYDEAFEGLDRTGVEAAVRVLEEAAQKKDLVLVVTHQDGLRDLFQHELRVVCDGGSSFVETVAA